METKASAQTSVDFRRQVKSGCTLEAALHVIGGRWKAVIIHFLLPGKQRYGELRRAMPSCTQRIMTLQLRELERDGLVKRTVYAEVPPRVEYELTAFGRSLGPVLKRLGDWGRVLLERQGLDSTAPRL